MPFFCACLGRFWGVFLRWRANDGRTDFEGSEGRKTGGLPVVSGGVSGSGNGGGEEGFLRIPGNENGGCGGGFLGAKTGWCCRSSARRFRGGRRD